MAIKKCKECGADISTKAEKCPKCGVPYPSISLKSIGKLFLWSFAVIIALGFVFALLADGDSEQPTKQEMQNVFIKDTCEQLTSFFGSTSQHSDLQKDEYWKNYQGKMFEWPLVITEVSAGFLGGYNVQCKCLKSNSLISDILISYEDDAKRYVLKLQVGQTYQLKGILKSQTTLLGLSADGIH
jgi:hypothetical protein